jgi:hypothetical protein
MSSARRRRPPPPPTSFAPRAWAAGEAVRVVRRRDGRKGTDATVRSSTGDTVRLLFDNGSEADVPAGYDARRAIVRQPAAGRALELNEDCARHVASYLSAKRALRVAATAPAWRRAAAHDADWRFRVAARWPYDGGGRAAPPAPASWRNVYRRRLGAERALRRGNIGRLQGSRFVPRFCADPCCLAVFRGRTQALYHHAVHPHSWLDITFEDEVWLNARAGAAPYMVMPRRQQEVKLLARDILARDRTAESLLNMLFTL